jgi:hypothetical protein
MAKRNGQKSVRDVHSLAEGETGGWVHFKIRVRVRVGVRVMG